MRRFQPPIVLATFIIVLCGNTLSCDREQGVAPAQTENGHGHNEEMLSASTPSDLHVGEPSDWCNEHGLPESRCTQCNPGLSASFQASGDWCNAHQFPESACPVCNPVEPPVGHAGPQTRVQLTQTAIETSGIRVQPVTWGTTHATLDVPCEVQFEPDMLAHINTLVDGQIVGVNVTVGDVVEVDDELATFRSVDLGQARADLIRATAIRDAAEENLERQEQLRDEGINSERSLLEAELAYEQADAERDAARSRLRVFGVSGGSGPDMTLESPVAGVIVERHATFGENVSPEDTLFVIADPSVVWVIGSLYESHVALVTPGMSAILTVNAHPGRQWSGVVDYVAVSMDETSRTLPIRIPISNEDGALRPGMFGTLTLGARADGPAAITVPLGAVQTLDNRDVIFVTGEEEGTFEARAVVLGQDLDGYVSVVEGLSSEDMVVVEGGFILKSELVRGQLAHGCGGD